MSDARQLLVVSFFYPPDPSVGGRRVAKFVQYLPEFGWTPTVLTASTVPAAADAAPVHATPFLSPWRPRAAPSADHPEGTATLHDRLGRGGPLRRGLYFALRHILPMSSVRMPDATLGWVPFALREGRRLLAHQRFAAILSSAGPPSSHIVAARLQRVSGLPWVADFRDLWSDNHWDLRIAPFRSVERRLERHVLRRAALLTTVAPAWAERLAKLHAKPAHVVYNGFDPDDYPTASPHPGFVITYIGSLYWPAQDPEPLFAAVAMLGALPDLDLDSIGFEIRFLGTEPGPLPDLARRHGVMSRLRILPAVPHPDSLREQSASAVLLFLGWHDPAEGLISAKVFEYLGAARPIIAVGHPGGAISEILTRCGQHNLSTDPTELARRLETWIREFQRSGQPARPPGAAAALEFTRRSQTGRLAQLLERAVSRPAG